MQRLSQLLAVLKDAILVLAVLTVGWNYAPLFIDQSLTSDFEVAEVNLLVVKLRPQASERAVAAVDAPPAAAAPPASDHADVDPDAGGGAPAAAVNEPVAYVPQQARTPAQQRPVFVPRARIVEPKAAGDDGPAVHGWSYVGTLRDTGWEDLIFEVEAGASAEDLAGRTLTAQTDVFIRDAKPTFLFGWTKGDPVGVIQAGASVRVQEVARIPAKGGGFRVWIRS